MPNSVNPEDRRKYPRSKKGKSLPVEAKGAGILNHVDNISANGILCHTVQPVPLMTRLEIVLDLPKPVDHRVQAEGIVVRCEKDEVGEDRYKVGIVFTRIDEKDQKKIQEYVEYDLSQKD